MSKQRKILLHLHTPPIPVDGGDKRRLTGTLKYFKDRQDFFATDALAKNDFRSMTWTQERQREVLKFVDNLFVYDGDNLFDFLYSRSQSFYHQTLWRQQLPINSDYFTPPGYLNFVRKLMSRQYDFFWINYIDFAHLAVRSKFPYKALLDLHDIGCQGRLAKKNVFPFKGLKFDYQSNFVREVRLMQKFDAVIVNSQQELAMLKPNLPSHKLCLVPHLVEDTESATLIPYSQREFKYDLLFVGTSRSPNVDGINFFLSTIFPTIVHQKPNTRLALAGTVAQAVQVGALAQNVDCLGYIPSLADIYLKSRIVICPLLDGAGTKVKLQEAMAYAIPVVTTTIGAAGMNFINDVNAFVTDDPDIYAQQIIRLLEKPELAQKLSTEIAITFTHDYSNAAVYSKLDRLFGISL